MWFRNYIDRGGIGQNRIDMLRRNIKAGVGTRTCKQMPNDSADRECYPKKIHSELGQRRVSRLGDPKTSPSVTSK